MRDDHQRPGFPLLQWIGRLPGVLHFASLIYCMIDPATPFKIRAFCLFAVVYLVLPIDLIPDFLLLAFGLGVMDDLAVIYMAYKMAETHILPAHRARARAFFQLEEDDQA